MWVGQRGGGHGRITEYSMLAISYIKAHGTQCSEENAGKYDRNDDTRLHTHITRIAVQAAVQLCATNAASMKAQSACAAPALHAFFVL